MLRYALRWVQFLSWLPYAFSARCLKGVGISLHEGALLNANIDGTAIPLNLLAMSWSSSRIITEIYRILLEEVLGYRTVTKEISSSWRAAAAVVGCQNYFDQNADWVCSLGGVPQHFAFELWESYFANFWQHVELSYPEQLPERLGSPGYQGQEIMFGKHDVYNRAWTQAEVALEYFKSYTLSRVDASLFFTNWSLVPVGDLLPCYDTPELLDELSVQKYLDWSHDLNGTDLIDGKRGAKCFENYWWVAPACRHSLQNCIPWVTTNWWGAFETMHKAAAYGLPFMLATTTPAKQSTLASNLNILTYSFVPNDAFVHAWDTRVIYPDYDKSEWVQGNLRTAGLGQDLWKLAWHSLDAFIPSAVSLARKLSVSLSALQSLLANLTLDQTSTVTSVACGWLLDNLPLWTSWILPSTDCFSGQGLANLTTSDGDTTFVDSRASATTCEWCMPGRYSVPKVDDKGATAICEKCSAGKTQMRPRQTQCVNCIAGTYSDINGAVACKRCEIGKWTHADNASSCDPCPHGTTRHLGSTSVGECVCTQGEYATMHGSCLECPDGMTCAFGSDMRLFPWLVNGSASKANGLVYPQLDPGYWSSQEDPFSIYKCENEGDGSCGGGLPGSCIGGRESTLCARCPSDYYVRISEEGGDPVHCHRCWALAGCAIPLTVLVVLMIVVATHTLANYYPLFVNATVDIVLFAAIGMIVLLVQVCGIFRYIAVPWSKASGLTAILDFAAPYAGTSSFFGIDCIIGQSSVGHYALLACIPWLLFLSVVLCFAVSRTICPYWGYSGWLLSKTMNTLGTIYSAIFITIANVCVSPASSYSHPNGLNSLVRYPEVISDSSMYISHVAISITMVVFPIVPYASACLWAVCVAPGLPSERRSEFYSRFRFLLCPFRPTCWWWGNLLMTEKLLLAFIPALPNSEPHLQLCAVAFLSLLYGLACVARRPWKPGILNFVDAFVSICFSVFGMLATSFLDASDNVGTIYGVFLVALLVVMLIVLSFAVFMAIMHLVRHPTDGFSIPFEGPLAGIKDYRVPVGLIGDFHRMCWAIAELSPNSLQALFNRMPISDWYAISECISVWHALAPETIPRPALSQRRLVHIEHSGAFTQSHTDRRVSKSDSSSTMNSLFDAVAKTTNVSPFSSVRTTEREINDTLNSAESNAAKNQLLFASVDTLQIESVCDTVEGIKEDLGGSCVNAHVQTDPITDSCVSSAFGGLSSKCARTPRTTPRATPRESYSRQGASTPREPYTPRTPPIPPLPVQNPLP